MACPREPSDSRFEEREEVEPVDVVDEQRLAVHAARGDVVDAFGRQFAAERLVASSLRGYVVSGGREPSTKVDAEVVNNPGYSRSD